jgi:hypothetical protein
MPKRSPLDKPKGLVSKFSSTDFIKNIKSKRDKEEKMELEGSRRSERVKSSPYHKEQQMLRELKKKYEEEQKRLKKQFEKDYEELLQIMSRSSTSTEEDVEDLLAGLSFRIKSKGSRRLKKKRSKRSKRRSGKKSFRSKRKN